MTLTTVILLTLLLFVVQIFLQETSAYKWNMLKITGNRDTRPKLGVIAARLDRAKNNMMEALPLFLGLALLTIARGIDTGQVAKGAILFLAARIVYVPVYVAGVRILRSIVWLAGMAGLFMMALPLMNL